MSRLNFLLLVIVVMCALSVVNATNRQRELFISLGRAQMQERQGQQELAQLQYQQSSLSKTSRVEDTSTSELKMESVTAGRTQYLTVAGASAAAAGDSTNPAGANASGASAADPSATTLGSGTMPTASAGDDSSNAATSSDLRAVIGAGAPARAAKPAASAALAASAPVKTTEKKAGKHAPAKPTKAANPSSVKHATKSTGANGVSK